MFRTFFFNVFLSCICCLSSCVYQKKHISTLVKSEDYESIFISIPESGYVFENIASMTYQALCEHFFRIGYYVADKFGQGYELRCVIRYFKPYQKYLSPDVLPFHIEIKLEILCQLYDYAETLKAEKIFYFSTLICRPRKPILTSSFLRFEYKKLMRRSIPRIEQYFRPFLKRKIEEKDKGKT